MTWETGFPAGMKKHELGEVLRAKMKGEVGTELMRDPGAGGEGWRGLAAGNYADKEGLERLRMREDVTVPQEGPSLPRGSVSRATGSRAATC